MERDSIKDPRKALGTAISEFPDEFNALPEDSWFKTTRPLPVQNRTTAPVRNKSSTPIPAKYGKDPAQAFNLKAREVMQEHNLDWPDAYRTVRKNFPEFWDAIPDNDPFKMALVDGIIKNRQKAAAKFSNSVAAYRNRIKVDYETAFAACKEILPDVYATMIEEI